MSAQKSYGFMSSHIDVHRTGAATVDHMDERAKQIQAIRALHHADAMDLVPMLFAEPKGPVG